MNTQMKLHLAKYRKYLAQEENVIVVFGDIDEIQTSRALYEERHGILSTSSETQNELLNACALAAASLSDRESWGWTLTLPESADGFFVGVEPEGMICTRLKPAEPDTKKVYLQRQKNDGPLMQSHFEPNSDSPARTVEQYFNAVVQTQTRIEIVGAAGILVQALPDCRFDAIRKMSTSELFSHFTTKRDAQELKPLVEFLVFYECRCDEKMVSEMVERLSQSDQQAVFDGQDTAEIECPRCGRTYVLSPNRTLN
ncbi:MAG: Hsp33 family molecular chaperone HslO [Deltaproteobacteria bacterium]|nr:Hsp33 family molecular chaperone HslO [Deltaproteobacteria bacterium]MBN2673189.1 Hsp33 family molecular chaperone HslO [Deltaproteobacteria bacterium]